MRLPPSSFVGTAATLLVGALMLTGCGGSDAPQGSPATSTPGATTPDGRVVRVVHSVLPMGMAGDDTKDMVAAMRLAMEEHGQDVGTVHVDLKVNDDSGGPGGDTDPARTAAITRTIVADPAAIGIIGTMTSSGTAMMAPIANTAELPVVGVSATAVRLTRRTDGQPGMPSDMAPTGKPNMARIVPNDARQSVAIATYMKGEDVGDVIILHDDGAYGMGLAESVGRDARRAGITVHDDVLIDTPASAARAGRRAANALTDTRRTPALFIASNSNAASLAAAKAAALANDRVLIFGPDSMALRGVYAKLGPVVERRVYVTSYLLPVEYYGPAGVEVAHRLRAKLGRPATPTALYAYEAMELLLASIGEALPDAAALRGKTVKEQRAAVTRALLHTFDRGSVVGTYSIDAHGDTNNSLYGAYRVEDGEMVRGQAIDTGPAG